MTAQPIRSEDTDAIDQLKVRIADAEKQQDLMKRSNRIIRDKKLTDEQKVARLMEEGKYHDTHARELLKHDVLGRVGFADFELLNNQARIRRMKERVQQLEGEGARASMTVAFPGGRMEDNAEEHRIRIYHDAKPGTEVIQRLKSHGFHWTPSLQCWQRLRNNRARYAASQITGVAWPTADEVQPVVESHAAPTVHTTPTASVPRMRP